VSVTWTCKVTIWTAKLMGWHFLLYFLFAIMDIVNTWIYLRLQRCGHVTSFIIGKIFAVYDDFWSFLVTSRASKIWRIVERRQSCPCFELSTTLWRRVGEWMYRSCFLDLGTSWRWVISFTPLPLNPRGKSHQYPLDRRLGVPQSQ
jgi:hypothetical protein